MCSSDLMDLGLDAEVECFFLYAIPILDEVGNELSLSICRNQMGEPNPLPFIQACHRITRSDGTFGGYRGGVEAKLFLLDFERQRASSAL